MNAHTQSQQLVDPAQAAEMPPRTQDAARANIRLAIVLGLIAFGFFLTGLYLATGGGS